MRSTFAIVIGFVAAVLLNSPALAAASPVSGLSVLLDQVTGKRIAAVTTDTRGVATFAAVPPGRYRITVQSVQPQTLATNLNSSKSNTYRHVVAIGHDFKSAAAVIDLSPGKTHTSEVTVPPGVPQSVAITLTVEPAEPSAQTKQFTGKSSPELMK